MGDIAFTLDGQAYNPAQAMAYKGMMLSDLPNVFMAMGYTMIATGTDTGLLQQGFSHLIQHVEKRG